MGVRGPDAQPSSNGVRLPMQCGRDLTRVACNASPAHAIAGILYLTTVAGATPTANFPLTLAICEPLFDRAIAVPQVRLNDTRRAARLRPFPPL
jgi:hypothetical protein